jgi:glyoxylase-like metal-dependent hydrolase (beta-lactamase superfamily II)
MATTRITRLGIVNAYLVVEDDGLTLIDTTIKGGDKAILAAAERLNAPIVRIALTHGHGDHVGALDALAKALPQAEVSISARDARPLGGDMSTDPGEPSGKLKGQWIKVATRPQRLFEPGDTVGSLQVVAAPGHTPGHVAFFDPRDGTLYCGDAFSTLGGVATTAKVNPLFPLPALATWDKPTEVESAKALRQLDPRALAPGHGKVVEAPGAKMDAAIAKVS